MPEKHKLLRQIEKDVDAPLRNAGGRPARRDKPKDGRSADVLPKKVKVNDYKSGFLKLS